MKGYLRIEKYNDNPVQANWYYDSNDPDQSLTVERLRRASLLTDASGNNVLFISTTYRNIGMESPAEIQARVRTAIASYAPGTRGKIFYSRRYTGSATYLVRAGIVFDEQQRAPYYAAIATPLTASSITPLSAYGERIELPQ